MKKSFKNSDLFNKKKQKYFKSVKKIENQEKKLQYLEYCEELINRYL